MMEYWGTAKKFSEKSEKSKKSRASEKAKERQYHGGSISVSEHEERMEKKDKKKPSRIEVLKHCFTSQDGELLELRSPDPEKSGSGKDLYSLSILESSSPINKGETPCNKTEQLNIQNIFPLIKFFMVSEQDS
ncbi:unnamed protein product [Cuscuta campestris]|uniref:Uncharacterized protein n=1 Tax=Cuscuta campestris TaxID=132261 RepID=A0A484M5Y4_9ASTE|nr:unnamed protein product [Cuscuta campestris]